MKEIKTADVLMLRIINKKIQCLLALRDSSLNGGDLWCIPGGHLNKNETPLEGIIREVLEETGVNLSYIKNRINVFMINEPSVGGRTCYGITYICILPTDFTYELIPQQNEVQKLQWFDINKIPRDNMAFDHGDILDIMLQRINSQ